MKERVSRTGTTGFREGFSDGSSALSGMNEFSIFENLGSLTGSGKLFGTVKGRIMSQLDGNSVAAPLHLAIPACILPSGIHFGGRCG
jgi:hypothetical protein